MNLHPHSLAARILANYRARASKNPNEALARFAPRNVLILGAHTRGVAEAAMRKAPSASTLVSLAPAPALASVLLRGDTADLVVYDLGQDPPETVMHVVKPGGHLVIVGRDGSMRSVMRPQGAKECLPCQRRALALGGERR